MSFKEKYTGKGVPQDPDQDSTEGCGCKKEHGDCEPCCAAIAKFFSKSSLAGTFLIEAARVKLEAQYATRPEEILAREQTSMGALLQAGNISRSSFAKLLKLSRKCDLICCAAAAQSLGDHYLTLVNNILTAVSAEGLPAIPPFPPPPIVNLPQALAIILSENQLSFDFILTTVRCKKCSNSKK